MGVPVLGVPGISLDLLRMVMEPTISMLRL